jgi:hypothetical protein
MARFQSESPSSENSTLLKFRFLKRDSTVRMPPGNVITCVQVYSLFLFIFVFQTVLLTIIELP